MGVVSAYINVSVGGAQGRWGRGVRYASTTKDVLFFRAGSKEPFCRAEVPEMVVQTMRGIAVVTLSPLTFYCRSCSEVIRVMEAWTESSYMSNGGSLCAISENYQLGRAMEEMMRERLV